MANLYWVGGTATWDATAGTKWASTSGGAGGQPVPTAADAVFFTNLSTGTCTVGAGYNPQIFSMNMTGHTGVLNFNGQTIELAGNGTIFTGTTGNTMTSGSFLVSNSGGTLTTVSAAAVTEANSSNWSFNAGAYQLTLNSGGYRSLTFTGFAGLLNNTALSIYGNVTLATGMTLAAGTNPWTFRSTTSQSINTLGKTLDFPCTVNTASGTLTFSAAVTLGTTRTFNLTAGTVNLAGFTLSTGLFVCNTTNTRQLQFGSGNITITCSTAASTAISMTTMTGFSFTGTSQFNCAPSVAYTISMGTTAGATSSNVMSLSFTGGSSAVTFATGTLNNFVRNLNFTGNTSTFSTSTLNVYGNLTIPSGISVNTLTFEIRATSTITGAASVAAMTINMVTSSNIATLANNINVTGALTHSQGTLAFSTFYVLANNFVSTSGNIRALDFTGGGYLRLTGSTGVISQSATNLTITGTYYAFLTSTSLTRQINFSNYTTSSLPPSFSGSGTSGVVSASGPSNLGEITFVNQINDVNTTGLYMAFNLGTANIFGNFTLASTSSCQLDGAGTCNFVGSGTKTITMNGLPFRTSVNFNNASGVFTLGGAFTCEYTMTVTTGSFVTANFNVVSQIFLSNGTSTRSINLGTSTVSLNGVGNTWVMVVTGLTLTATSSTIDLIPTTTGSSVGFYGAGQSYNLVKLSTANTSYTFLGNNTFSTLQNYAQPLNLIMTAGTTNTFTNFNINGTAGNLVSLYTTAAGTRATVSKSSGTVNVSYVSIKDSSATGGATWTALPINGNVNAGNNTGWNFGASVSTGNMFLMFR